MNPSTPDRLLRYLAVATCAALLVGGSAGAQSAADMTDTKHNLSVYGPGPIRASGETRICVFCHTPHNATPLSPLWNRKIEPRTYTVYTSPTLTADPVAQPTGPTKLCLTCHDGTIAMGAVVRPEGGIPMSGSQTFPAGSLSDFGFDLSSHHPVSFRYDASSANPEIVHPAPLELTFGATDELHCSTCHDPHDDRWGRFLVKDNRFSALCTTCHSIPGWAGSAHATSTASVVGVLPRLPKDWPNYPELREWGCETCHTPHFAPTAEKLLNFTPVAPEAFDCTTGSCHGGGPAPPPHVTAGTISEGAAVPADLGRASGSDIARQIGKLSAHRPAPGRIAAADVEFGEVARSGVRGVACADCHQPHETTRQPAEAPYASGLLRGVRGVDRHGADVAAVTYEYEVCFKCHGDDAADPEFVPRAVPGTNARRDFDDDNPSFHAVVGRARTVDVPSLPSTFEPTMQASDLLYCTDCHADDEGSARGPHGSTYPPILRDRYETADGTFESFESYALCYRCHDRASILRDDSFRPATLPTTVSGGGHSGHLAAGASCAACHDAHGIAAGGAGDGSGSHTHLINFDRRVAEPLPGEELPRFEDTGAGSGSCSLVCHGVVHDATSYP